MTMSLGFNWPISLHGADHNVAIVNNGQLTIENGSIVDKQPTGTPEGSKHQECTVCKHALASEPIAKPPR